MIELKSNHFDWSTKHLRLNLMTRWGGWGIWEGSLGCNFFYVGRCVLREWVVRGGGLGGYFGEQAMPVDIQEYLERFPRGCVDYLSWQFISKWDSPNCEGVYSIAVGGTCRRGRVAICGLDV